MLESLNKIYKGKKVFLTGHTGFKGSWLLVLLNILGAEVKGYSLPPVSDNDHYYLIDGDRLCHSHLGDIRNQEELVREIESFQPDFIFHLAAQPLVRLSYELPSETFMVNAIGTAHVLDGIRKLDKPCYGIFITTDKVYHNNEWLFPYRESDRLGGHDPYSASKACTELIIDSYRKSYFNPAQYNIHHKSIAVGRAGNVIGGGDWSRDRLFPDIASAIGNDAPVIIRNPNAIRPWQHVLEPLIGYLMLGMRMVEDPIKFSDAFNFGPYTTDALSVEAMVRYSMECWDKGSYQINDSSNSLHEAGLLKLDISKAVSMIGWTPMLDARSAVKITVNWYKQFYIDKSKMAAYTQEQSINYLHSYHV